jgi:uncharacterized protein involved in outer membrane biogenesis
MKNKALRLALKILAGGLLGLALLIAGLLAYLSFADLARHHALIESLAARGTGRPVSLEGPLNIDMGREIQISVGRAQLANATWSPEPYMLDMHDAHIVIETRSLFRPPLIFKSISLASASIVLDRNQTDGVNWNLNSDATQSPASAASAEPFSLPFIIEDLDAGNLELLLRGPNLTHDLVLLANRIRVHENEDQRLKLSASGRVANRTWSLEGDLGTLASLVSGQDLNSRLALELGASRLALASQVASLREQKGISVTLDLTGADLENLTTSLGLPGIAKGPFDFKGDFLLDRGSLKAQLKAAAGELSATMEVDALDIDRENPSVNARITGRGPNLGALAQLLGLQGLEEGPFSASGEFHSRGKRLEFEQIHLDAPSTRIALDGVLTQPPNYLGTRVTLSTRLPDISGLARGLGLSHSLSGPAQLEAQLEAAPEGLVLRRAELDFSNAHLSASGKLGNLDDLAGTELALEVSTPGVDQLGASLGQPDWPALPLQAQAKIRLTARELQVDPGSILTGKAKVDFSGTLDRAPGALRAKLALTISAPSIKPFGPALGIPNLPDQPLQANSNLTIDGKSLLLDPWQADLGLAHGQGSAGFDWNSDGQVSFSSMIKARGRSLKTLAEALELDHAPDQPWQASGRVTFHTGNVRVTALEFELGSARLSGQGEYMTAAKATRVAMHALGPDVRVLHPVLQKHATRAVPFQVQLELDSDKTGIRLPLVTASLGGLVLDASGSLGNADNLAGSDFRVRLRAQDLADTLSAWTTAPAPAGSFGLEGQLKSEANQLNLHAESSLGQDKFLLDGSLANLGSREAPMREFKLKARAEEFDLDRLRALWPAHEEAEVAKKRTRIIPDMQFPQTWPSDLEGIVNLEVEHLQSWGRELRTVRLAATLDKQGLSVNTAQAEFDQGTLTGTFHAVPVSAGIQADMDVSFRNMRFQALASSMPLAVRPPMDVDMKLTGQGTGLRELAAELGGSFSLRLGAGKIGNQKTLYTSDFVSEALNVLNPFRKDESVTLVECGLVVLKVQQGMMTPEIAMAQTNRLLLGAEGQVNLSSEAIEVLFTIMGREGLGISASSIVNPYVKIGGTLAKPTLVFAPTRAALNYGAAVATGGLSLLAKGIWDRLASSGKVCEKEVARRGYTLPGT